MGMVVHRFEVYLVGLDPTVGSEMQKTRPCLVVSPDDLNGYLRTVIIAPMMTAGPVGRFRVPCRFEDQNGRIALDQLRVVDKQRLLKYLGRIAQPTQREVLGALQEMFS
ncbi:MAG: type II toxin-antitoxin system PemK/MazF family toxin [Anaerolineae bacterium]|nr:type II toxin-antitoxin system PemK/MazF family toxin [Anaerolineae bacterium]